MYEDRSAGGRALGALLRARPETHGQIVLALSDDSLPVAVEAARALRVSLAKLVVHPLWDPHGTGLLLGVESYGLILPGNPVVREASGYTEELLRVASSIQGEPSRQESAPLVSGRRVVLVDDIMVTGTRMQSAANAARALGALHVTAAVPASTVHALMGIRRHVDEVACTSTPEPLSSAVGAYSDPAGIPPEEAIRLLNRHRDMEVRA